MKANLLTTTLLLATTALFAQDNGKKILLLDSLRFVTTDKNYVYIRTIEDYNIEKDLYAVSEYNKSGKINMKAFTKNKDILQLEGLRIDYYENGNKKSESNYTNDQLTGKQLEWYDNAQKKSEKEITWDSKNKISIVTVLQFWDKNGKQTVTNGNGLYENTDENLYEKGEIKNGKREGTWVGTNTKNTYSFSETYKKGEFISGISSDKNNQKYPYKEIFTKPIPERGLAHFYKHVGKTFKTPDVPGLNGKVYISFVVDNDGTLTDFKIIKDIGYDTGKEAIKALSTYDKWTPGKTRGISAKVMYSLPITINYGN